MFRSSLVIVNVSVTVGPDSLLDAFSYCVARDLNFMLFPVLKSSQLSRGMGWLSPSRALRLFASNLVMGLLFGLSQLDAYFYAFATSISAGIILLFIQRKTKMQ